MSQNTRDGQNIKSNFEMPSADFDVDAGKYHY
jgi:hypothetical protein